MNPFNAPRLLPRVSGSVRPFRHLARRREHTRFRRIESISPRNHVHVFRLSQLSEIDDDFRAWLAEAYLVGEQRHLESTPGLNRSLKS